MDFGSAVDIGTVPEPTSLLKVIFRKTWHPKVKRAAGAQERTTAAGRTCVAEPALSCLAECVAQTNTLQLVAHVARVVAQGNRAWSAPVPSFHVAESQHGEG